MPKRKPKPLAPSTIAAVERARAYIGTHCLNGATLEKTAKAARLSACYLHRSFTQHFSETPKSFQTRMQIDAAKLMMENGDSLVDVARRTGFSHAGHFSARFRAITGMTPTKWMAKNCK